MRKNLFKAVALEREARTCLNSTLQQKEGGLLRSGVSWWESAGGG